MFPLLDFNEEIARRRKEIARQENQAAAEALKRQTEAAQRAAAYAQEQARMRQLIQKFMAWAKANKIKPAKLFRSRGGSAKGWPLTEQFSYDSERGRTCSEGSLHLYRDGTLEWSNYRDRPTLAELETGIIDFVAHRPEPKVPWTN